jgi:hypothetical protein
MIIHNTPGSSAMTDADFKAQLKQQLPDLLRQDAEIRALVLQAVDHYFANRQETDSRFDRVLAELQRDRQEQALKWDDNTRQWNETLARMDRDREAQTLKWDEQNRKWDENARRQDETLAEIKAMNRKHDSTIGALGVIYRGGFPQGA